MNNYLDIALEYNAAGLRVVPFSTTAEGKKVFPKDYADYRAGQTPEQVRTLFARPSEGIAILCTDRMEVIDIDVKHDPKGTIADDLLASMESFGVRAAGVVQKTKSGGFHLIYRCPVPEGNQKLAKRIGQKEAMIETRGPGGLIFAFPSPGYEIVSGDITNIPQISQEDRDLLLRVCRHFDERQPIEYEKRVSEKAQGIPGEKPWEAYDKATDILQLMEHYGWRVVGRHGEYIRLNRPGAKHSQGVDASVIPSANLFYPFTSSSEFDPNKCYGASSVYAIMEHRGNFSAAAKALYRQGFGDRIEQREQAQVKERLPQLIEQALSGRFDMSSRPTEPKPLLKFIGSSDRHIGGRGMIGIFTGHEKSGKSFVASCIAASGLKGGREVLNFSLDLDGGKMLWFDTEQSGFFFHKTQERIHRMAGQPGNTGYYDAFHLRKMSAAERLEVVEHFIYNTPALSVVMIDGFVDLMKDYNDLEAVQEYVGRLMKWSDERQVLIMGVLHVNKGDGKIRGHIGSELKNKCDFIINTAREESQFTISNPTSRYLPFQDMDFTRDAEGLPVYDSFFDRAFFGRPAPSLSTAPDYQNAQPFTMPRQEQPEDMPF